MSELISLTQKHQSANDCMLKEKSEKKHQKINHAIQYCMENDCRGIRPLPFQSSKFLLMKTSRLDGTSYPILKNPKLWADHESYLIQ